MIQTRYSIIAGLLFMLLLQTSGSLNTNHALLAKSDDTEYFVIVEDHSRILVFETTYKANIRWKKNDGHYQISSHGPLPTISSHDYDRLLPFVQKITLSQDKKNIYIQPKDHIDIKLVQIDDYIFMIELNDMASREHKTIATYKRDKGPKVDELIHERTSSKVITAVKPNKQQSTTKKKDTKPRTDATTKAKEKETPKAETKTKKIKTFLLNLRVGKHHHKNRLVFECNKQPVQNYVIEDTKQGFKVIFLGHYHVDKKKIMAQLPSHIHLGMIKQNNKKLVLHFIVHNKGRIKDFKHKKMLVVDVFKSTNTTKTIVKNTSDKTSKKTKTTEPPKVAKSAIKNTQLPGKSSLPSVTLSLDTSKNRRDRLLIQSDIGTKDLRIALYERSNRIWLFIEDIKHVNIHKNALKHRELSLDQHYIIDSGALLSFKTKTRSAKDVLHHLYVATKKKNALLFGYSVNKNKLSKNKIKTIIIPDFALHASPYKNMPTKKMEVQLKPKSIIHDDQKHTFEKGLHAYALKDPVIHDVIWIMPSSLNNAFKQQEDIDFIDFSIKQSMIGATIILHRDSIMNARPDNQDAQGTLLIKASDDHGLHIAENWQQKYHAYMNPPVHAGGKIPANDNEVLPITKKSQKTPIITENNESNASADPITSSKASDSLAETDPVLESKPSLKPEMLFKKEQDKRDPILNPENTLAPSYPGETQDKDRALDNGLTSGNYKSFWGLGFLKQDVSLFMDQVLVQHIGHLSSQNKKLLENGLENLKISMKNKHKVECLQHISILERHFSARKEGFIQHYLLSLKALIYFQFEDYLTAHNIFNYLRLQSFHKTKDMPYFLALCKLYLGYSSELLKNDKLIATLHNTQKDPLVRFLNRFALEEHRLPSYYPQTFKVDFSILHVVSLLMQKNSEKTHIALQQLKEHELSNYHQYFVFLLEAQLAEQKSQYDKAWALMQPLSRIKEVIPSCLALIKMHYYQSLRLPELKDFRSPSWPTVTVIKKIEKNIQALETLIARDQSPLELKILHNKMRQIYLEWSILKGDYKRARPVLNDLMSQSILLRPSERWNLVRPFFKSLIQSAHYHSRSALFNWEEYRHLTREYVSLLHYEPSFIKELYKQEKRAIKKGQWSKYLALLHFDLLIDQKKTSTISNKKIKQLSWVIHKLSMDPGLVQGLLSNRTQQKILNGTFETIATRTKESIRNARFSNMKKHLSPKHKQNDHLFQAIIYIYHEDWKQASNSLQDYFKINPDRLNYLDASDQKWLFVWASCLNLAKDYQRLTILKSFFDGNSHQKNIAKDLDNIMRLHDKETRQKLLNENFEELY